MKHLSLIPLIVALVVTLVIPVYSQISTNEKPVSFSNMDVQQMNVNIPVVTMPNIDLNKLQKEDEEDTKNGIPPRFGYKHEVNLNLSSSGKWQELPGGGRLWRLTIVCPNALSINLLYDKFFLPEGGKFFVYDRGTKQTLGAFTERNNKGKGSIPGKFATGLLYGNKITLEYFEPKDVENKGIISIAYVVHGYRYIRIPNIEEAGLEEAGFGDSGSCQVNINCPEGNNWQTEKKAVALIIVDGTRWCTGSLVNNTSQDFTPYFLTADHCLGGWANSTELDAITNPNANTWSFYWNYESPNCTNPTYEPWWQSTVGATVVANDGYSVSDFALLELTEDPREIADLDPYYLGWERSASPGSGGVGIHHPNGDVKKIATHTMTPSTSGNYWHVYWNSTTSGHSVTEGGSSGSCLLNSSGRLIGQLYGGSSLNCSDPANDLGKYGKLSVSWTGAGASDKRRRLRDWLDPSNLGVTSLDGLSCPPWFDNGTIERTDGNPICAGLYRLPYSYWVPPYDASTTDYYHWELSPYVQHTIYNQGTNDIDLLVSQPGTYTLSVTVEGPCGPLTSSTHIDVEDCGSAYSAGSYTYSPNPSDNELTVTLVEEESSVETATAPPMYQSFEVKLFDDKGNAIRSVKSQSRRSISIPTANLPNGLYYLYIIDEKEVIKKQILIQH